MARPLRALLVGAVLCCGTAAFAFSSDDTPGVESTGDGGTEDMAVAGDMTVTIMVEDMSAAVPDMAKRPDAAKASLPGCSIAGSPVAPVGSALVALALVLWAMRPRLQRVRARRTARRRP